MSDALEARRQGGINRFILTAALAAAGGVMPLEAAHELRFTQLTVLGSGGLRVRLMQGSRERPLAPPTVYTYEYSRTGEKTDLYDPRQLWRREQHLGRWEDPAGTRLTLLAVRSPLPAGFTRKHVNRSEYEQAVCPTHTHDWSPSTLQVWLRNYLGLTAVGLPQSIRHNTRLSALLHVPGKTGDRVLLSYFFRFRQSPQWYAAHCSLGFTIDAKAADAAIRRRFFDAISQSPVHTRTAVARRTVHTRAAGTPTTDEYAASRADVIESVRNMKDWWFMETPHHLIMSDLSARDNLLIRRIQSDIEPLRRAFEQFIAPRVPVTAISVVRVFSDPDDYAEYVPANVEWTSGVWVPAKKELVIRPIDWGRDREKRESLLQILYHESFHQYLFYALDRIPVSMWFNEGHADFFGGARIRGNRISIRENEWRVRALTRMVKAGAADIQDVLDLSQPEFYGSDSQARQRHYAISWGLVYYLHKGAPLDHRNPYANVLTRYVETLWDARDPDAASSAAFRGVEMERLQADFESFWQSRARRNRAEKQRIAGSL